MSYTCPYLLEDGYGRYYCHYVEDYINKEQYNTFCCQSSEPKYKKCPVFMHIESTELYVGYSTICATAPKPDEYDD